MKQGIGSAGHQARRLALDRRTRRIGGHTWQAAPSGEPVFLPVIQRAGTESHEASIAPESAAGSAPGPVQNEAAVGRERRGPSPEDIAARVYELLRHDVRLGRER